MVFVNSELQTAAMGIVDSADYAIEMLAAALRDWNERDFPVGDLTAAAAKLDELALTARQVVQHVQKAWSALSLPEQLAIRSASQGATLSEFECQSLARLIADEVGGS